MNYREEEKQINPETVMQLQSYLKVLGRLASNRSPDEVNTLVVSKYNQLEKLLNYFITIRPKKTTTTFRKYGDKNNEAEMVSWEAQQPVGKISLLTRPDGVKGVLIKHDEKSSNWYTVSSGLSDTETADFFQNVIATNILSFLLYSNGRMNGTEELSADQLQTHSDWVVDLLN